MASFARGIQVWFQNLPLFAALVLTIWVSGQLLLMVISLMMGEGISVGPEMRLHLIVDGLIDPIVVASILFATDQIVRREPVGYLESLTFGFRTWGRLFATRFVANLIVVLGFLCVVIPGVVMLIRFAFIDQAVVLDGLTHRPARQRSVDLVPHVLAKLLGYGFLFLVAIVFLSTALSLSLALIDDSNDLSVSAYRIGEMVIACLLELVGSMFTVVLYFLYQEAAGQPIDLSLRTGDDATEFLPTTSSPYRDDGNPYGSPLAE